jgi:hypothetical protein
MKNPVFPCPTRVARDGRPPHLEFFRCGRQALVKHGVCLCDLAEQLGMHPKRLSPAVKRGGPPALRRGRRGSLLDPYRPVVDRHLAEGVWMSEARGAPMRGVSYPGVESTIMIP